MYKTTARYAPGPREWVPNFKVVETLVSIVSGVHLLVNANPNRVSIIFSAVLGGSSVLLTTVAGASLSQGISLIQNYAVQSFSFSEHGGLVQQAWYANASGPGATLTIVETLWLPEVGD